MGGSEAVQGLFQTASLIHAERPALSPQVFPEESQTLSTQGIWVPGANQLNTEAGRGHIVIKSVSELLIPEVLLLRSLL